METIKTEINIGIKEPFTFLHMSDTHLTLTDERDDERKIALTEKRGPAYTQSEFLLDWAAEYATKNGYPICHTGDLIDFVSWANIERAKKFSDSVDLFMVAGNHEFSLYVGEAWEDADYRNQSLDKIQAIFHNDIRFSCREVNGVNLVAIDNGYYLFEPYQLEGLKEIAKQGKPIILLLHTPLYTEEHYAFSMARGTGSASLMAVPEEKMQGYNDHRYRQQKADETTLAAYDYIMNEPLIKALLVGHNHLDFVSMLKPNVPQIMTGCTTVREITVR